MNQVAKLLGAILLLTALAPSPAGPVRAGPVFAARTKILNIKDMHFKHTFKLGEGYWPKVKQRSKAEWSCYSVAGLSLTRNSQILSPLTNLNGGSHFTDVRMTFFDVF